MLVINGKVGERIRTAEGVDITVLAIRGQKVRLGIDAPESEPAWEDNQYPSTASAADADQAVSGTRPQFSTIPD